MSATRFAVSAPASSANLGAGFDAVALALELRMTADVRVTGAGEQPAWSYGGSCAPTHDGIRRCLEEALRRIAGDAPSLAVTLRNEIPLGAGLGSSAAAYALGAAIGLRLRGAEREREREDAARTVVELEGHPDNALAAWFGGAVVAAHGHDGLTFARFAPPDVAALVVVPELVLSTADARALMPASYARADAVHNVQRAALLGAALASGRVELLRAAVRDRLHHPYRAGAIPGLDEILEIDDPGLVAVALSGAGPSVLALVRRDDPAAPERIAARVAAAFAAHGVRSRVLRPALARHGILAEAPAPGTRG